MKEINLHNMNSAKVGAGYFNVPQPMYAYDSIAEFKQGLKNNGIEKVHLLKDYNSFNELYRDLGRPGMGEEVIISAILDKEVWIATGETSIYHCWSPDDRKEHYKDKEGHYIRKPTDNTFIRLYKVIYRHNSTECITSTGIYLLSQQRWDFSSAIKVQFKRAFNRNPYYKDTYEERLELIVNKKKANVDDHKVFNLIFNPMSDFFMNPDGAVGAVYPGRVRKADRMKVVKSKHFIKLIQREVARMLPELTKGMKGHFTPEKVAELYQKVFDKDIETGNTESARETLKQILTIGHTQDMAIIEGGYSHVPVEGQASKQIPQGKDSNGIEAVDISEVANNTSQAAEDVEAVGDGEDMTDENLDRISEESGVLNYTVMDDFIDKSSE